MLIYCRHKVPDLWFWRHISTTRCQSQNRCKVKSHVSANIPYALCDTSYKEIDSNCVRITFRGFRTTWPSISYFLMIISGTRSSPLSWARGQLRCRACRKLPNLQECQTTVGLTHPPPFNIETIDSKFYLLTKWLS